MADSLTKARRLFHNGRFNEVVRLVEPFVFKYRDNSDFFRLLGVSCLYLSDFGGAFSYLSRAQQIDPKDLMALLGLAAIHFRRNEIQEAVKLWLNVLDLNPDNAVARRALQKVRTLSEAELTEQFRETEKIKLFFPRYFGGIPPLLRRMILLVPIAAALIVASILIVNKLSVPGQLREGSYPLTWDVSLSDIVSTSGSFDVVMTEDEIRDLYLSLPRDFNEYRDNTVRVGINRLLLSNASSNIKERARVLLDFMSVPTLTNLDTNYDYAEVRAAPAFYDGAYVIWQGQATNIEVTDDEIRFVLLVGYETRRIIEGIVSVRLPFAADIVPASDWELLGRVVLQDDEFYIEGVALRPLYN